jgi:Transposase DDE domain
MPMGSPCRKVNQSRRHKIPKVPQDPESQIPLTSWLQDEATLVRRRSLTVWFTEEAVGGMACTDRRRAGRSADLFGDRIKTGLALRLVFHQPLRQTEGLNRRAFGHACLEKHPRATPQPVNKLYNRYNDNIIMTN